MSYRKLTIRFSGIDQYQQHFTEILPHELNSNLAIESLIESYDVIGKDNVINIIIESAIDISPILLDIISDYAYIHYHGDNLISDIEHDSFYLCSHETYS